MSHDATPEPHLATEPLAQAFTDLAVAIKLVGNGQLPHLFLISLRFPALSPSNSFLLHPSELVVCLHL